MPSIAAKVKCEQCRAYRPQDWMNGRCARRPLDAVTIFDSCGEGRPRKRRVLKLSTAKYFEVADDILTVKGGR